MHNSAVFRISIITSLMLILSGVATISWSQNKQISAGYHLKTYSFSLASNAGYEQPIETVRKGFLGIDYTTDISDHLFLDVAGNVLVPKRQQTLSTGPMAFNAANGGISIGARLGNFDLMTGAQGGLLWNLRVKAASSSDSYEWLKTEQPHSNFTGSLTAGLRYHFFDFLSLSASVSRNFYQYRIITPRNSFGTTPAFDEADLQSYSAQVGVAFGVPWKADLTDDRDPTYRRGAPIVEDRRLSLSYEMRGYTYSYYPNSNYSDRLSMVRKGFLRARYKQYLTKNFFLSGSGGYLIPSRGGSFFSRGPINFQAANMDLLMGIRWGRISLYTGIEGGLLWDMRLKSRTPSDEISWNAPANIQSSFTAAFKAGMEYHLFKNLSVKAKFFYNSFQHSELQPEYSSSQTPAVSNAEMAPFSAGLGISVSIPWKSDHNKGAPPPSPVGPAPPKPSDGDTADDQTEQNNEQQQPELPPMVERPPESTPAQLSFTNPIPAQDIMTSYFGDQRMHEGLDINAEKGDEILSIAKGTVVKKGWNGRYGQRVVVEHPAGFKSIYAHLSSVDVDEGQEVAKGTRLGAAGNSGDSTGAHLHFELLRMDLPINPRRYIIHDWEWWKDEKN